jgi:N-acetylmuramoyl-L-alanine amidase
LVKKQLAACLICAFALAFGSLAYITGREMVQAAAAAGGSRMEPVGISRNGIFVAYPQEGLEITAASTYVAGAVSPGSQLTVNGQPVRVNGKGFFAHIVPLSIGNNQIKLVRNGSPDQSFEINVHRPAPPPAVPSEPLQIASDSVQPLQDIGVSAGDIIELGMRGSPGGQASVRIGAKVIPLQGAGGRGNTPNAGLNTAFGVTYQGSPALRKDLYTGFYKTNASDNWQNETPEFTLSSGGTTVRQQGSGRITLLSQPFLASTLHDDTVVRVGPGAGRATPLPAGVRVLIDGYVGDSYRCAMSVAKHLWIDKADLSQNEGPGSPPSAQVRTINIENEGLGGGRLVLPLNQRLPFDLKQEITPGNRIQMRVYGATSNTDWVTEPSTSSRASEEATQGKTFPKAADRSKNPVQFVTWQQIADDVFQATINLNLRHQWGYWAEYQGTNLVLHIKGPPHLVPGKGLQGLKICLDPGHGGPETGAIGCSGTKEATINLAIAKYAADLLRQRGAAVVMTRTDDIQVSLEDRVKIASDNDCNLLLSIHNNSLPDGRNPWTEHGTSSYYYHPQALSFANLVRQGIVKDLGFVDYHTRWQNLALCRPSRQPSALAEVGFMVNPDEYATLITEAGQERAARGIVRGINDFLADSLATGGGQPSSGTNHHSNSKGGIKCRP